MDEQTASKMLKASGKAWGMVDDAYSPARWMVEAVQSAVAGEREACAKRLEDAASALLTPKRTNQIDRHVASVLQGHADAIRAL
jgi:hypothetical protein